MAARNPVPGMAKLPKELVGSPQNFTATIWERSNLFPALPVRIRLVREKAETGRFGLAFSLPQNLVKPDVIVYWVPGNPIPTDTLPENALLLGALIPKTGSRCRRRLSPPVACWCFTAWQTKRFSKCRSRSRF